MNMEPDDVLQEASSNETIQPMKKKQNGAR